jgi:hypothetical protein
MIKRIQTWFENAARREKFLLLCLIVQLLFYWIMVFVLPTGKELVAYQRY